MSVPEYAVLLIILTSIFISSSLSVLLTTGLNQADLKPEDKKKFAIRTSLYILVWVSAVLGIAYSNVLVPRTDLKFPLLPVLILGPTILGSVLLFKSHSAKAVLDAIPIHWLATIQLYRVVGVVFLLLGSDSLLSGYFATSTGWGDIFVGVTAPVIGYLLWKDAQKFRWLSLAWCVVGIGDLLLVLYKAINSAPGPLQTTSFDVPTVIIGYFPFVIIPLLVVPLSLILHIQMIRKIFNMVVPRSR